ncbi:ABC transporter substrate-binding protein [Pantoea sp. RIT-PI-b]|uniref:ABC transporter ATP-binding protein n=1 Tax=Pantoea sp. RIT-PI-b TaxID=1681195 RepID=UPI00067693EA|nr:ABC transporter ATP-binding protein [Pantoea sp. RIT-PI-b]KNC12696.1 ABC transporter substrate-binding protein [Pantoea sp. RIT-PI-b]
MTHAALPIELKNLRWSVGNLTILHDLSLTIPAGEILALLGPSGCGKSTLLKLLAGLLQPTEGELWIGERCVASARHCDAPEKRNLGMVFQDYALWPHMSVAQNVAFPLRMRGIKKAVAHQQADAALAQVGLADFGDRKPALLSGGQQQRVALARALVAKPAILLFDEPLSNLDRDLRETLVHTMADLLRTAGITAVYVTHDREEANTLADRIIHLAQGQIVSVTHLSGDRNAISQVS